MENPANYSCKIDECIEAVQNTEDKSTLNFSDLARTYELTNVQGKQVSSSKNGYFFVIKQGKNKKKNLQDFVYSRSSRNTCSHFHCFSNWAYFCGKKQSVMQEKML